MPPPPPANYLITKHMLQNTNPLHFLSHPPAPAPPTARNWYEMPEHKPMMLPPPTASSSRAAHLDRKPAFSLVRHPKSDHATAAPRRTVHTAGRQHQLLLAHQLLSRQQRAGVASASAPAGLPTTSSRNSKTRYVCPQCSRTFSQSKYLTFHLRWECGRKLSCPKCKHPFNSKSYLNLHVKKCTYKIADGRHHN